MNQTSIQNVIGGAIFGGIGGAVSGIFGVDFWGACSNAAFWGSLTSYFWGNLPRTVDMPSIAVESFGVAGLVGAILMSAVYDAGFLGALISCVVGYLVGLLLPALYIESERKKEK